MDGWKEMTLLPLSEANEMIKNETVLVRQNNDVTSCGKCGISDEKTATEGWRGLRMLSERTGQQLSPDLPEQGERCHCIRFNYSE